MSKTVLIEQTTTLGGRITCRRCQVISSNGLQCRRGAMKSQVFCHGHSELPKGPRTPEGRQRCAAAKTIHGFETRQARTERALGMRRLRELEDLGHLLGILRGSRTPGRKPASNCVGGLCFSDPPRCASSSVSPENGLTDMERGLKG